MPEAFQANAMLIDLERECVEGVNWPGSMESCALELREARVPSPAYYGGARAQRSNYNMGLCHS